MRTTQRPRATEFPRARRRAHSRRVVADEDFTAPMYSCVILSPCSDNTDSVWKSALRTHPGDEGQPSVVPSRDMGVTLAHRPTSRPRRSCINRIENAGSPRKTLCPQCRCWSPSHAFGGRAAVSAPRRHNLRHRRRTPQTRRSVHANLRTCVEDSNVTRTSGPRARATREITGARMGRTWSSRKIADRPPVTRGRCGGLQM